METNSITPHERFLASVGVSRANDTSASSAESVWQLHSVEPSLLDRSVPLK